jgi:hypothetical protein
MCDGAAGIGENVRLIGVADRGSLDLCGATITAWKIAV